MGKKEKTVFDFPKALVVVDLYDAIAARVVVDYENATTLICLKSFLGMACVTRYKSKGRHSIYCREKRSRLD